MRANHVLVLALMGGCASGAMPEQHCDEQQPCAADSTVDAGTSDPPDADGTVDGAIAMIDAQSLSAVDASLSSSDDDASPPPPIDAAPPPPIDAMIDYDAAAMCGNAVCESGETCTSCAEDCAPPDGPTGLTPTGNQSIVAGSVTLDWEPHCDATSYDVAVSWYSPSLSAWTFYFEWSTSNDDWTFWPVVDGDFYFEVRAVNTAGTGPYSVASYFNFTEI
jgi:hypothetical protein